MKYFVSLVDILLTHGNITTKRTIIIINNFLLTEAGGLLFGGLAGEYLGNGKK
jgi:hypothetical protein